MKDILLFTDGSVDVKSKTGYGAYLATSSIEPLKEELKNQVKTRRFKNTSSTRLELETLLWALNEIAEKPKNITVFTDSQNIAGLIRRRERLEQNNFRSKNNRLMNNHDLYREFFRMVDTLNCDFVKVTGHQPGRNKDEIHRIFALVDKASRKALRKDSKQKSI